ncbi:MAG: TusE/DsrC/DsvC family sulfur relay protein [Candidatus Thermoplasmatota archaeon]|jgi:tRNA 2-thiouridine synthesizing protein E|nr:TusE/DsrC/DsvC family sulfur relay protein [Candidatus Thermoplasmatota archaeon]MCL6091240.1 TusE/DsrC/DsvC family sulfur relay protein [Candidatus Thermoplasmatota archaeon]
MGTNTCPGEYEVNGKKVSLDEDCFIQNPELWNEDVASWLAKEFAGVEKMTEEHWKLVKYLRSYWETYGVCPPIKVITKNTGITLERMYDLFPDGPAHGACKVAGAPKPTGCV